MFADNQKVIVYSVAGGFSLWLVDAALDSAFFSSDSFFQSLFNPSAHELYFRSLFLVSFIVFGWVVAGALQRRKSAQDDLKRAIVEIQEEKAKSEAIVAAIGDGISIQDEKLKVLYQNRVHREIVGGDKIGEYCYHAYGHNDGVCPGCPVVLTFADGNIHTLEKTLQRGNQTVYIEIKSSPLRDPGGKIIAGIEAVRDITDSKKTVEKLRLYLAAIEEAIEGIQIVDLDGYILYSNRAVQEIYGFSPEELAGKHVNEMNVDPEFASRVIIPGIRSSGRWSGEMNVKRRNGALFPVWLSTSLVNGPDGQPIAMVGIIRDITERKKYEEIVNRHREQLIRLVEERTGELSRANEQLRREMADREKMEEELVKAQKLESLGMLAGGIAHDFNNLLASMLGNISLAMLDLEQRHPAYSQLAAAERASLRAQDLTRQLLTFSKGGAPVKKISNIGELVKEASGFALRGSRVRCDINIAEDLFLADIDEGQIAQAIQNLVINADHAMPEGGIIRIICSNIQLDTQNLLGLHEGSYVKISVEDNGVGIRKEHLAKIFDPYFTTKQKGSGLGLATTYSIIKKHGGNISVQSVLGSGTAFHVYLPASRVRTMTKQAEQTGVRKGSGRILVMDDEMEVRETTGNVLTKLGYTVDYAVDGMEAIDRYRAAMQAGNVYDLVIMDLTIPGGMGGNEAIKTLREVDPKIKAIVSSGYSNDPIMSDFRKYGFAGVVTKPYRLRDLSEEVHRIISGGE